MSGEKTLVAVDESNCSRKAFEHAVEKSNENDYSKLTALTVLEEYSDGENSDEPAEDEKVRAESLQKDLRSYAKEKGVELDIIIKKGPRAADIIVEFAESNDYDLIIIGSHGRTESDIAKLGSVSQSVARDANMPVLIIT